MEELTFTNNKDNHKTVKRNVSKFTVLDINIYNKATVKRQSGIGAKRQIQMEQTRDMRKVNVVFDVSGVCRSFSICPLRSILFFSLFSSLQSCSLPSHLGSLPFWPMRVMGDWRMRRERSQSISFLAPFLFCCHTSGGSSPYNYSSCP